MRGLAAVRLAAFGAAALRDAFGFGAASALRAAMAARSHGWKFAATVTTTSAPCDLTTYPSGSPVRRPAAMSLRTRSAVPVADFGFGQVTIMIPPSAAAFAPALDARRLTAALRRVCMIGVWVVVSDMVSLLVRATNGCR